MAIRTTTEDMQRAFNELEGASDRTTAIVGAVLLEAILEDAIVTRLRPMSNTHRDLLFEGESGFAGFAAKINLGFSLGLYGSKTKNDFDYIRKVRNQFAHHLDRHFAHPEITKHCNLITNYAARDHTTLPVIDPKYEPVVRALLQYRDYRWRYLYAVMHFIKGLFDEMLKGHHPRDPTALSD
jgi:hypothetical protein